MAHRVLNDAAVYFGAYNLTTHSNALACEYVANAVNDTMFGDTTETSVGGVKSVAFELSGAFDAEGSDAPIQAVVGTAGTAITFGPTSLAEGDAAYFFDALVSSYSPRGSQGDLFGFDLSATGAGAGLARGATSFTRTVESVTTGTGTVVELAGVTSGTDAMYLAYHIPAVSGSGTTFNWRVVSGTTAGMTSSTVRYTGSGLTTTGSGVIAVFTGTTTDTYWRVDLIVSAGTSPSVTAIGSLGII